MIHSELPPFDVLTVTLNPAIDRTVTISNFVAGEVNRVEKLRDNPGGKGVNVASALADYGHAVAATGFLGRENCDSFETLFARKQIADRFVRIAGHARVCIKITDPVQRKTTDINFPGPKPIACDVASLRERIETVDAPWVILAGSLPPGIDPFFYRDLIISLKAKGRKVVVDVSGEPLKHAIEAVPTIIKPNVRELETYLGRVLPTQAAVIDAAQSLAHRGIKLVTVSMGKEGACFVGASGVVVARPPCVEVLSTVGAGDAMVAGVVSAQIRQLSLEQCACLATAFSMDSLGRIESGLTSASGITALMAQVAVETVVD